MKLEAVTVCINYADRLALAIPFNQPLLDRWIIVTEPGDLATRHLCRKFGLQVILSEDHRRDGDEFNKGRLVERGLHHASAHAWRLHLDADIILPSRMRRSLDEAHLDERNIYGVDRIMVHSKADWQRLVASGWLHGAASGPNSIDFPRGFEVGARWASRQAGFVPIGFWQLWHSSEDEWLGVRTKTYPIAHGTACRTDVQHSLQWDRRNRVFIPEILVAHFDEGEPHASNWKGRKAPPPLKSDVRAVGPS